MGFEKGHTGPYTTKIESVYDICVGGTLLAAGLCLCLFQGIGGVQDGILRHRATTVCTGGACGLITVFGWRMRIKQGGEEGDGPNDGQAATGPGARGLF